MTQKMRRPVPTGPLRPPEMQPGPPKAFANQVVLVTGGAAGIGRAIVEVFRA